MKKRKIKRNNARVRAVIVIGFLLLYIVAMLFSTYQKKEQYRVIYENDWRAGVTQIFDQLHYAQEALGISGNQPVYLPVNEDGTLSDLSKDFMEYVLTNLLRNGEHSRYCLRGITIADREGNLIAKTADRLMYANTPTVRDGKLHYSKIRMEDYFDREQMEQIQNYYEKECNYRGEIGDITYDCLLYYDDHTDNMVYFSINEKVLVKILDNGQHSYKNKTVFSWSNPEYEPIKHYDTDYICMNTDLTSVLIYPYLHEGKDIWEEWRWTGILHDYIEKEEIQESYNAGWQDENVVLGFYLERPEAKGEYASVYPVTIPDEQGKDHEFLIQYNMKIHPWQAAMDELKEIYLYGAVLVAVCMSIVLYVTNQTDKKQKKLEEARRDFTNAIAHELKTPLTIVRGLVENMDEEESEEQKVLYRKELVNQTERMDDLVKEMIFISKLDSDKIRFQEEEISMFSLIEEQMDKLKIPLDEKNLSVQYWKEEDFIVKGDKSYLEKAMFNLLENAAAYNLPDGSISISLYKDRCVIENTADRLPEEELSQLCELFFTGDKSRNPDDNHKGFGLYLVKKIFDLHGMEWKIENSDIGVKVTIY